MESQNVSPQSLGITKKSLLSVKDSQFNYEGAKEQRKKENIVKRKNAQLDYFNQKITNVKAQMENPL